jgi:hypothetical protein
MGYAKNARMVVFLEGKHGNIAAPHSWQQLGYRSNMIVEVPPLQKQLETRIQARTGKRVRNLKIQCSQGEVVLMGETATYHVKQLAQHGVLDIMPSIRLYNRITVH